MIHDLLESFFEFVKYITILCFKWFLQKIIFSFLNDPFNNNIAILESKIIYFCLRPNFCGRTTLMYHFSRLCQSIELTSTSFYNKIEFSIYLKKLLISSWHILSRMRRKEILWEKFCGTSIAQMIEHWPTIKNSSAQYPAELKRSLFRWECFSNIKKYYHSMLKL